MSSSSHSSSHTADETASLWAARIEGSTLTSTQRKELDAWLAQDPAHRTLLTQYCQFSADLEDQLPALVAAGDVSMPDIPDRRRSRGKSIWWIGTFTMAAAAAIAVMVWPGSSSSQFETIATSVGKRQEITLADGTHVQLNAQTTLAIEASRTERHVRLTSGEAFFEVSKDPTRPFIVETPAGSVRVTGTKFDVHTETASSLDVTVLEGSVQVRAGQGKAVDSATPVSLKPGNQLVANGGDVVVNTLSAEALDSVLAWRNGMAEFKQTALKIAVAKFARYHDRQIVVAPEVANLPLTATSKLDDLDGFLATVEEDSGLPVNVRRANGIVYLEARPSDAARGK